MHLTLIPGAAAVLFLLNLGTECFVHAVAPGHMLEGLRVLRDASTFAQVHREEPDLDELLAWCGNV